MIELTDKKISELVGVDQISVNDESVIVAGGETRKYSFALLLQFLAGGLAVGASINFGTVVPQNNTGKNGDLFIRTSTGQFVQKINGQWSVVFAVPTQSAADGTVIYGTNTPGQNAGKNGDTYIDTLEGIFYFKSEGNWAQVFSMQTGPQGPRGEKGEQGATGANGKTIYNGIISPSNALGTDGDFYIKTDVWRIYGPKANGQWGAGVPMVFNPLQPYAYKLTKGGPNPVIITDWQSVFASDYGNGEFVIQFADEDGNMQDRLDITVKRIISRPGGIPVQTGISFDFPEYPDGQIIIKYSNLTLI